MRPARHNREAGADRRQIAALAGVAPYDCDSGQFRITRRIRGGRRHVRNALYIAAVSARGFKPDMKKFYERLNT